MHRISPLLLAALLTGPALATPEPPPKSFEDAPVGSYSARNADGSLILWGQLKAHDFGPVPVTFDYSQVRQLRPVPVPGVHPRMLITPDDLPDLKDRIEHTRCGQEVWKNVQCWCKVLHGTYDDTADYAQPDRFHGNWRGVHGRIPALYMHDATSIYNPKNHYFDRLAAGDTQGFDSQAFWGMYSVDALRCWVEGDATSAQKLANAVMTSLRAGQEKRDAGRAARHETGPIDQPVGAYSLAFVYDFIYNWLTPEQRAAIHDELASTTWHHDNYGAFGEATASRSNWATFTYWLFEQLAIEGEPGFNPYKLQGMFRGWRNFLTYGILPSGCFTEGESKDQLGMMGVIAYAMRPSLDRDFNLAGHPRLQKYAFDFLPHSYIPEGLIQGGVGGSGHFLKYDLLGGVGALPQGDLYGLKYMFPHNKVIDFLYRKSVGEDYERVVGGCTAAYDNPLIFAALFPSDFDPSNNDAARLALSPTYFAGDRGLMLTRSDWSDNALVFGMHVRGASGGHPYSDRNSIFISGMGRVWGNVNSWKGDDIFQSEVVIDNQPQEAWTPARIVAFDDQPQATFCTGDAKYAWDWAWKVADGLLVDAKSGKLQPKGTEPETHTFNDFAFTRLSFDYANQPLYLHPNWINPPGFVSAAYRLPNYPVKMAYRTAGIVRGKHPYALVVDDIRKDDKPHHYDWSLLMNSDLRLFEARSPADKEKAAHAEALDITVAPVADILPSDTNSGISIRDRAPALLVRVLDYRNSTDFVGGPAHMTSGGAGDYSGANQQLVIPADAVNPGYKVLLYPYLAGQRQPVTTWNNSRTEVTVNFGDQMDMITFKPTPTGRTQVTIARQDKSGGAEPLIDMKDEVPPLAEK